MRFVKIYKKIIVVLLLLVTLPLLYFLYQKLDINKSLSVNKSTYKEEITLDAQKITGKNYSYKELEDFFQKLAKDKGAEYAFEVLKVAQLPPNTDLHLLGHAVGDILYKQEGADGIKICTEDFRNACSHSIVVGLFSDKGEQALPEISQACQNAPGGSGAYTMCFHGLGHGILAAASYDIEKALKICQKIAPTKGGEAPQCMGGMVMEIVGGGGHDKETWGIQRKKYLKKADPLSLCRDIVPDEGKVFCYVYITPFLWESKGADFGNPTEGDLKKAFPTCNKIPKQESANWDACYGGFGKEFVGLVAARDIRKVDQMDDSQMKTISEWCKLAESREGAGACIVHALNSIYWGGENDRAASERFCGAIEDEEYFRRTCYMNLITNVSIYIKDSNYRKNFCQELPEEYKQSCQERLLRT